LVIAMYKLYTITNPDFPKQSPVLEYIFLVLVLQSKIPPIWPRPGLRVPLKSPSLLTKVI